MSAGLTDAERAIIETLRDAPLGRKLSVNDLARTTGFSVTTVGRVVRILAARRHVQHVALPRVDAPPIRVYWPTRTGRAELARLLRTD